MKKIIIYSYILGLSLNIYAQTLTPDVFAISGGSITVGNINLTWTIGEAFTETFYNNFYLTNGFNQVDTIIITVIETNLKSLIDVKVFPSPTKGLINVEVTGKDIKKANAILYDFNGKEILAKQFFDNNYKIDLSSYQNGIYILIIYDRQSTFIKKFKIEKL